MKALTVGSAMIDTIAIIASDSIERMSMRNAESSFLLLEEGRKTDALDVSTHCGGGAINTAVAMSRLGLDVATLVKLGRDARAEVILARLMEEKVSTRWVLRDERAPTGASVLISSHDRNAGIFTFRGANTLLEPQDLRDEAFAVDLCFISNLSNKSAECFPPPGAKGQGTGSPGGGQPWRAPALRARRAAARTLLASIDILTINRAEADVLVPSLVARFGDDGPRTPGHCRGAAAAACRARPCRRRLHHAPDELPARVTRSGRAVTSLSPTARPGPCLGPGRRSCTAQWRPRRLRARPAPAMRFRQRSVRSSRSAALPPKPYRPRR